MRSDERSMYYFFSANYPGKTSPGCWRPNVDIFETESDVVVALEVPGVSPEDIQITQHHDKLMVRGIRHLPMEDEPRHFHQIEISNGRFEKEIVLSRPLHGAPVKATLSLGILRIKIAKKGATRDDSERKIPITGGNDQ